MQQPSEKSPTPAGCKEAVAGQSSDRQPSGPLRPLRNLGRPWMLPFAAPSEGDSGGGENVAKRGDQEETAVAFMIQRSEGRGRSREGHRRSLLRQW